MKLGRPAMVALLVAMACTESPSAPTGGTVVIGWQQPDTLNLLYSTGTQTNALVARVAVEGLLRVDPGGAYLPVLAASVPTPANGGVRLGPDGSMTVTYRLNPGVRWADGARFTSDDVRYTWLTVMSDQRVASREGYDRIADVETPDPLTAVVRYRAAYASYLDRFDVILPQHALAGQDLDRTSYGRSPLGTGPFRITEFVDGDHITAERNPQYREPGRPRLDRVIFRIVSSVEAAKAQLRVGEIDAAPSLSEADAAELEKAADVRVTSVPSSNVEALSFNLARPGTADEPHPVLSELRVRQALLLATPKRRLVDALLAGRARPGSSEIPLGWGAASVATQGTYDPQRARALLDAAGWTLGPDGVRVRQGARASLRLVSTTGNRLREQVEQVMVDEWRAIGFEVAIQNVPTSVLTGSWSANGVRKRGTFDVLLASVGLAGAGSIDPQTYLSQRRRCDAIPAAGNNGAGANYERFCDRRVDALLEGAAVELDQARRAATYRQVLGLIDEEVVNIYLFDRARVDAFRSRVAGYRTSPWDVVTWNVQDWSVR